MKTLLVTVALALAIAPPSFAAIQYEFMQKNTSDDEVQPVTDLTARAVVDGSRSRVDFIAGNVYPPGTYVIATDNARRLMFVDPVKKWYTEVNHDALSTALSSTSIKIENLKTDFQQLPDRETIAGIEASHGRVTMSYDIILTIKAIPLKQHVRTEIDTWSTKRFGALDQSFLAGGMRTGNPQLDQIIEAETDRVEGFPLRQVVTIRTSYDLPIKSNLKTPTTRTITRETWVTKIGETQASPSMFTVPASYRRSEQPEAPAAAAETLQFDPPSGN
ncbi:MAG TPA: hypothetical protein VE010_14645 [Thermoanaerobaculia bacterium]|nr:hypothetical protein [Thermoanaerobaculia bacterium]